MNLQTIFLAITSVFKNILSKERVFLVSEPASWAIFEDCRNIQDNLAPIKAEITYLPFGLRNKVIHFASENTFLGKDCFRDKEWYQRIHPSNKIILTWFHISENDSSRLHLIPLLNDRVDFVHTASQNTKQKLIKCGLKENKVVVVPLGVNLDLFRPVSTTEKNEIRKNLGIPKERIVIGSFQKDGNGWGEGLEPKLIKGPDIFCDVLEKLAKKYSIHALLTGPARGYVKNRLETSHIPYTHAFLEDYKDIARYYQAIDMYLITSREEGGPKALLESLASGIPLISTQVGMVPEVIQDGENGFVVDIEDTNGIFEKSTRIIENDKLKTEIITNGLETIQQYSFKNTIDEMYIRLYEPLLKRL
jgi:glycosyltransferase involved in cell wall biosynthesis